MKLTDDYEEPNRGLPLIYMSVGVAIFIIGILAIVLIVNKKPPSNPNIAVNASVETTEESTVDGTVEEKTYKDKTVDELISGSKLTSDQLDIWDVPKNSVEESADYSKTGKKGNTTDSQKKKDEEESTEEDMSKDGNHTLVVNSKGEEEWVTINPYLKKNNYDFSGLVYQAPIMKYFENSRKTSYMGVSVSKNQGLVDYNKLKKAGVDFVMVGVGSRGYGSGQLAIDDYYLDNLKGASDVGLNTGIYFYSQAITEEEAVEEANLVIQSVSQNSITYPVAFRMESVDNDTARTDSLTRAQRSKIADAFLKTVKEAGYKPIIYGNKEWLIKKLDLSALIEYDIWLSQEADIPDYPYKFSMWQYAGNGKIDGIAGKADLSISFIDYSKK